MATYNFNPRTQEAGAGGFLWLLSQRDLYSKFQVNQGYLVWLWLQTNQQNSLENDSEHTEII